MEQVVVGSVQQHGTSATLAGAEFVKSFGPTVGVKRSRLMAITTVRKA